MTSQKGAGAEGVTMDLWLYVALQLILQKELRTWEPIWKNAEAKKKKEKLQIFNFIWSANFQEMWKKTAGMQYSPHEFNSNETNQTLG